MTNCLFHHAFLLQKKATTEQTVTVEANRIGIIKSNLAFIIFCAKFQMYESIKEHGTIHYERDKM